MASILGVSPWRTDGEWIVSGEQKYAADLTASGMLFGAVVWATFPHAQILDIDVAAAIATPGVVAVFTHQDIPGDKFYGKAVKDQPVLAVDRVRFVGDKVALVVAQREVVARDAALKVRVQYEPLPTLVHPKRAFDADAPQLFESGNLAAERQIQRGDVARAFAEAAFVQEATFSTPFVEHAPLEPEAVLAICDGEDHLTVIAPSQNVFFDRAEIARILNLERHSVRVIASPAGGAFGKREDMVVQPLAALAAWLLKKPVRITLTREESLRSTTKRHPMIMRRKLAADQAGSFTALEVDILADTGAYTSWAPNILRKACVHATGPYEIPNVHIVGSSVFTNNAYSGAFRGFGATQVLFAAERHVDLAAHAWGFDPIRLREINLLQDNGNTATQTLPARLPVTLRRCLDSVQRKINPRQPFKSLSAEEIKRGIGYASVFYGIGYGGGIPDISGVRLSLQEHGYFLLQAGTVDYGQGFATISRQIAAQELGSRFELVDLIAADSERTPDSGSTVASRQTMVTGKAVQNAAAKLRQILTQTCAEFDLPLNLQSSKALRRIYQTSITEKRPVESFQRHSLPSTKLDDETGQGDAYATYAFGAQAAEVEVNVNTGAVRVLRFAAAHDVGKVLHPNALRGQVCGAIAQGLGMALFEDYRVRDGYPVSLNFDNNRLPRAADLPEIEVEFLESPDELGPFGARGIGEPAMVGTAPAIANAVCNALGLEFTDLPLTPERIRAAFSSYSKTQSDP